MYDRMYQHLKLILQTLVFLQTKELIKWNLTSWFNINLLSLNIFFKSLNAIFEYVSTFSGALFKQINCSLPAVLTRLFRHKQSRQTDRVFKKSLNLIEENYWTSAATTHSHDKKVTKASYTIFDIHENFKRKEGKIDKQKQTWLSHHRNSCSITFAMFLAHQNIFCFGTSEKGFVFPTQKNKWLKSSKWSEGVQIDDVTFFINAKVLWILLFIRVLNF